MAQDVFFLPAYLKSSSFMILRIFQRSRTLFCIYTKHQLFQEA